MLVVNARMSLFVLLIVCLSDDPDLLQRLGQSLPCDWEPPNGVQISFYGLLCVLQFC